jgi:hypothetical protein
MRLDYFIYVFRTNAAVEHTFRIDRDGWTQLALIEAPRLIASGMPRRASLTLNSRCNSLDRLDRSNLADDPARADSCK